MSLFFEIGVLVLGTVFVLTYVLNKLIKCAIYFNDKDEEDKKNKELESYSKHLYS